MSSVSTHEQVREAYRSKALLLHPDRQSGEGESDSAAAEMRLVNEAWNVLGDPARRAAYDADLARGSAPASAVDGTGDVDFVVDAEDEAWTPTKRRGPVAQFLPVVLVLLGLLLVLVITAYAR